MSFRYPGNWMWAEACALLEQADRLQRQSFQLGSAPAECPIWEPPVDIVETEREIAISVALPGVEPDRIEVHIQPDLLIVVGERPLPINSRAAVIRRLEIPYGRFERRIELPRGRFELTHKAIVNGCIQLGLRKF